MDFEESFLDEAHDARDTEHLYQLLRLQVELLALQRFIYESKKRLMILFEGRDTAGKGSAIARFTQHLNPRFYRTVALIKPTDLERGQWYFQRYFQHLPNAGEVVFFDRSWYNRAVVEPALGFCSEDQYRVFMSQVLDVERLLTEDGIDLVKIWFSIDSREQHKRLEQRRNNPLKTWKLSQTDLAAFEKWEVFTQYKVKMFEATSTPKNPWVVINGNNRKMARLQAIRYVLSLYNYPDKGFSGADLEFDPEIVKIHKGS